MWAKPASKAFVLVGVIIADTKADELNNVLNGVIGVEAISQDLKDLIYRYT